MIAPDTFARYAAMNVPRYTSYPTAPNFRVADSDAEHRNFLAQIFAQEPVSLYLHIPFCREMCWYCGCHTTVAHRRAPITRYVANLAREIRLISAALPERLSVAHIHWGGGTPTLLTPMAVRALDRRLRRAFRIASDAEISVEVDPRTLTPSVAEAFVTTGVNRVSIGVQTFDPLVQRAINRVQSFEQTEAAVGLFRRLGVAGVNLDLIYGLPGQINASCRQTVRTALEFRPDRLSVFGYAHVPAFKPHQGRIDEAALPTTTERHEQAMAIAEELLAAGYQQIGLDHFALPDDPLACAARAGTLHRNFQGYTTDACRHLVGLGASAISRLPGAYVQNAPRIPDYQRALGQGHLPTARSCRILAEDAHRADIIEQLMCRYEAELGALVPPSLAELERDGLVRRSGTRIEVPREARPLVRAVAAAFDAYLPQSTGRHVTAV